MLLSFASLALPDDVVSLLPNLVKDLHDDPALVQIAILALGLAVPNGASDKVGLIMHAPAVMNGELLLFAVGRFR